jgi:hypothetical protein
MRSALGSLLATAYSFFPSVYLLHLLRSINQIQLNQAELSAVIGAIRSLPRCNFLVFGVGRDSVLWMAANRVGRTAFLEDSPEWQDVIQRSLPAAEIHTVEYITTVRDYRRWLFRLNDLGMTLPDVIRNQKWDVILVDAPAGWRDDKPGRMQSIFEASRLVSLGGHIFVHDCDREAERVSCDVLLQSAVFVSEVGSLRHYVWPRK